MFPKKLYKEYVEKTYILDCYFMSFYYKINFKWCSELECLDRDPPMITNCTIDLGKGLKMHKMQNSI